MRTVSIDRWKFQLPEAWNEMNEQHCRLLIRATASSRNKLHVQTILALEFLNLKLMSRGAFVIDQQTHRKRPVLSSDPYENRLYHIRHGISTVFICSAADIALLASSLDFLFSKPRENVVTVNSELTSNFLPTVKLGKRTYHGPRSLFDGVTFGQFEEAEIAWAECSEGNPTRARDAMAAMYKSSPFERETPQAAEQKRKDFQRITNEQLRMFALYYEGSKKALASYYSDIFGAAVQPDNGNPFESQRMLSEEVSESFVLMTNLLSRLDTTKVNSIRECYLYDTLNTLVALKKTTPQQ